MPGVFIRFYTFADLNRPHLLPSEQLTMVMRYQNIIQNDKDIKKYLSRKKQNFDIPELFELMNWLSMNYGGYNYIFHHVEEEEFNEEEYVKENM